MSNVPHKLEPADSCRKRRANSSALGRNPRRRLVSQDGPRSHLGARGGSSSEGRPLVCSGERDYVAGVTPGRGRAPGSVHPEPCRPASRPSGSLSDPRPALLNRGCPLGLPPQLRRNHDTLQPPPRVPPVHAARGAGAWPACSGAPHTPSDSRTRGREGQWGTRRTKTPQPPGAWPQPPVLGLTLAATLLALGFPTCARGSQDGPDGLGCGRGRRGSPLRAARSITGVTMRISGAWASWVLQRSGSPQGARAGSRWSPRSPFVLASWVPPLGAPGTGERPGPPSPTPGSPAASPKPTASWAAAGAYQRRRRGRGSAKHLPDVATATR